MLTFDEWYQAKSGGYTFDGRYMRPHMTQLDAMRGLAREIRDYVSEMVAPEEVDHLALAQKQITRLSQEVARLHEALVGANERYFKDILRRYP